MGDRVQPSGLGFKQCGDSIIPTKLSSKEIRPLLPQSSRGFVVIGLGGSNLIVPVLAVAKKAVLLENDATLYRSDEREPFVVNPAFWDGECLLEQ